MKPLQRRTVSIVTSVALALVAWTIPAWGQGANPPAGTKASGVTSGRGETAVEQTTKDSKINLVGCLAGPTNEGDYTLTPDRAKDGVKVSGAAGVDLKSHVGHQVKLTGMWASTGTTMGQHAKTGGKIEQHFKATRVQQLAPTCEASSEGEPK